MQTSVRRNPGHFPTHLQEIFMSHMLRFFCLCLVLVMTTACGTNDQEPASNAQDTSAGKATIKIGAVLRLSRGASDGLPARHGMEIAVDQINAAGGINGKQLEIIFYDSKDDSTTAVNAVQKLISVDKVQAIVGPMMSGNVLASAPLCNRNKVVMITPSGTSPKISQAGPYVFRLCTPIHTQAKALVTKAVALSGKNNPSAAIVYSNDPYGKGCKNLFTTYLEELGITPVGVEAFQRGDKDFQAQLTKIESLSPDILFIPGYLQETAPLISQARQMGIDALSVGVFGDMAPLYVELAGKAGEGHLIAGEYDRDYQTQINSRFKSAYEKRLQGDTDVPDNIMFASLGFDSVRMLAEAFQQGATSGPEIKDYLDSLEDFNGVTGKLSFDSNGDVKKGGVYLFQVMDGKYEKIN
jgi:branched-chain amino acid transport system substrate-binding protein